MDELERRTRALEAEQLRPGGEEPTTEELLYRLIGAVYGAFCTPADEQREAS
jgi:hypothetical protein